MFALLATLGIISAISMTQSVAKLRIPKGDELFVPVGYNGLDLLVLKALVVPTILSNEASTGKRLIFLKILKSELKVTKC
ncbi:unnamed protein product [Leptidea sinapis]|uniref:Uncharacterized protein n=1 Tax=Leptidea sinapis TaxID=189913 RepID=A0A5E4QVM6_9NEOP|nr:unnamed protein product [Leptidea sinapis]